MCRVVDTVLIDQEAIYAPRFGNDRLLLGLKGSLNEYEFASELDGFGVFCGSDEVQGEVTDNGHVLCPEALSQTGLVVAEDDVQHPVQATFDSPVATHRLGGSFGVEAGRGDIAAGLLIGFRAPFDASLDTDDAGDVWQSQFAGEATVAGQPIDLPHDAGGALFDAAMALSWVMSVWTRSAAAVAKQASTSARRPGWFGLDRR
jgi:hypothetical protein